MDCVITYNPEKGEPVVTITGEGEADEMMLELLSSCEDFTIVVELQDKDQLIFKDIHNARN